MYRDGVIGLICSTLAGTSVWVLFYDYSTGTLVVPGELVDTALHLCSR